MHPPPLLHLLQLPGVPDDGTKWLIIGGAVLLITYTIIRPMAKKRKDPLDRPVGQGHLAKQRAVEREMGNLLVELSEMARQITAQLDTRATKLELLIREADEKIERLEQLHRDAAAPQSPAAPPTHAPAADDDDGDDEAPAAGAPVFRSVSGAAPVPSTPGVPPASDPDSRHAAIYALADQGLPPRDIARELGRPTGEVELILALRPQQPAR